MHIKFYLKHFTFTDSFEEMAEKKLDKLNKYFDEDVVLAVNMSTEKKRCIVELTAVTDGTVMRAEESSEDMLTSLEQTIHKMERQLIHHRTKLEKRLRKGAFSDYQSMADEDEDPQPQITKTKRFAIKPLDVEEAMMQMQLLGHSFFVFVNATTSEVNVLYKRFDGDFGLLEPEF